MVILISFGVLVAAATGMGVVLARRGRRPARADQTPIDADKVARWVGFSLGAGASSGEFLPPPDDGRPSH